MFKYKFLCVLFFLGSLSCVVTRGPQPLGEKILRSYPSSYEAKFEKKFSKFFYINLDGGKRSLERRKKMEAAFRPSFGDKLSRFSAVCGRDLKYSRMLPFAIQKVKLPKGGSVPYKGALLGGLSQGEFGCYLSHYQIWKEIAEDKNNDHIYLVTEDDLTPRSFFKERLLSTLYHAPKDWELLFLYSYQAEYWGCHYNPLKLHDSKRFLILDRNCTPGLVAYVLRPATARKLVKEALPVSNAVDRKIGEDFIGKKKIKVYAAYPELVETEAWSGSIIDEMGGRHWGVSEE